MQIDIDPTAIDRNYRSQLRVTSDAGAALRELTRRVRESPEQLVKRDSGPLSQVREQTERFINSATINSEAILPGPQRG